MISEFEASLVYRGSSRTARATQKNPVSERKKERKKEREREREKGRKEGRKEGRKKRERKEGRKEGRKKEGSAREMKWLSG